MTTIALVVAGLMVFGGGRFFTETVTYVAYFPETISGLNDGAPVNFRGVKVGTVRRIEVQLDAQDLSVKIPVYLRLERRRIREIGGTIPEVDFIPELIDRLSGSGQRRAPSPRRSKNPGEFPRACGAPHGSQRVRELG